MDSGASHLLYFMNTFNSMLHIQEKIRQKKIVCFLSHDDGFLGDLEKNLFLFFHFFIFFVKIMHFSAIFLLRRKIFPAKRKIFPAKRKIFRLRRANIFLPSSVTLYFETKLTNFPHIQINGTAPDRSCTTLSFFALIWPFHYHIWQ